MSEAEEDECPSSNREQICPSLPFCFHQALSGVLMRTDKVRVIFTQLINSNTICSRNTLTDTTRGNVLPALWISRSPFTLKHKINHHTCPVRADI